MRKYFVLFTTVVFATAGSVFAQTPAAPPAAPAAVQTPAASVQFTREQVVAAKEATALLLNGKGSGTAFCISESGLFVTCNHVVKDAGENSLSIVINPSQKDEKKYPAHILRTFPESDLAILKVDLDHKIATLKIGDDSSLFETQQLFAFGYPFGVELAEDAKSYPAISVNSGHITSLRRRGDVLDAIQLDALLNPGNSGGPVLDDKGDVVGIVSSGLVGSGINFAIPVSQLKNASATPMVSVDAPAIAFEKRFAPADFAISATWLSPQTVEPAVILEITSKGQTRKAAATKGTDGKYHALIAALPPAPAGQKLKLNVTVQFQNGSLSGQVDDLPLLIQGKVKLLSEIQSIIPAPNGVGFVADGAPAGPLPELAHMNVDIGGTVVATDGQKAQSITIAVPGADPGIVTYKAIVATANGTVLATAEGNVSVSPVSVAPATSVAAGATPASLPLQPNEKSSLTGKQTIDLPSPLDDVVAAENGRVLIFHLSDVKKLAVFDVVDLKMRGYINLADDRVLYAGGDRYLLVAYPVENLIARYSLKTLQKDLTITNPMGEMTNLAMGYSSPLDAMFFTKDSSGNATVNIFNAERMAMETSSRGMNEFEQLNSGNCTVVARASGDGRTFGFYRAGISPSGFSVVSYKNGRLSFFYKHETPGLLVPNADGTMIFTGQQGIYTPQYVAVLKGTGQWIQGTCFIPSYHPAYFLGVKYGDSQSQNPKDAKSQSIGIYVGRNDQPVAYLDGIDEMSNKDSSVRVEPSSGGTAMTPDKRYHFFPQLNLLITIPSTNDKLVARHLDIKELLDAKGVDYLYVTTLPPSAKTSQRLHFKLEAISRAGGVTFSLQSGPQGLTVGNDGTVDWQTPARPTEESVIVSIKDKSGREIYFTFAIPVTI